jgi:hypothetical protein
MNRLADRRIWPVIKPALPWFILSNFARNDRRDFAGIVSPSIVVAHQRLNVLVPRKLPDAPHVATCAIERGCD